MSEFKTEKELQRLIELNLKEIFNCTLIGSEFSTGSLHAGRIDTLALSEENYPVIIEYKKLPSSELITQSLYYLHWIKDHKGDYQIAVNNTLRRNIEIDWSEIRVICIAPEFRKYDLHAVQTMSAGLELWQYKLYESGILNLEEVFRRSEYNNLSTDGFKNPKMVEAGKKAADSRKTGTYSIEQHLQILDAPLQNLLNIIRDFIISIDSSIQETPKKYYISYKTSQNFVCLETHKGKLILYLKINPEDLRPFPSQARDVRSIGHLGTGDLEITIRTLSDFENVKHLIIESYKNIGG